MYIYIFMILIVVEVVGVVLLFNILRKQHIVVDELWSNIAAALVKRHAVIPRLVAVVKASSAYELQIQRSVAAAGRDDIQETSVAESELQKNVVILIESYPEMRVQKNFKILLDELMETEDVIQGDRLLYNRAVSDYNRTLTLFPYSLVASAFGFTTQNFFEVEAVGYEPEEQAA